MNISKKSILIVDSEISIRQIVSKRLVYHGYKVFIATNGVDALKTINSEYINLIIQYLHLNGE